MHTIRAIFVDGIEIKIGLCAILLLRCHLEYAHRCVGAFFSSLFIPSLKITRSGLLQALSLPQLDLAHVLVVRLTLRRVVALKQL